METILTLDKSSRVVFTAEVRRALGVQPGGKLRLNAAAGRGSIESIPVDAQKHFKRRKGRLVYAGPAPDDFDAARAVREERDSRS